MRLWFGRFLIPAALLSLMQLPVMGQTSLVSFVGRAEAAGGGGQTPGSTAIPRARDGKPDLTGIWQVMNIAAWDIQDHSAQKGIPAGQGVVEGNEIPYQPWAAARQKQQASDYEQPARIEHVDTQNRCLLGGVPRLFYNTTFRILQPAGSVVFVWDDYHSYRVVPLDGRRHVGPNLKLWMGDSVEASTQGRRERRGFSLRENSLRSLRLCGETYQAGGGQT